MTPTVPSEGDLIDPMPSEPAEPARLKGLTVAAMASVGAGVIHAAAAGVHAEHPRLAQLFIACAVAQIGVGLIALARSNALVAWLIVVVNGTAFGGWLTTRLTGVSWIDGLQAREPAQFADTACALLAVAAVGCALGGWLMGSRPARPPRLSLPALPIAVVTVLAMFSAGTHVHSHTHTAAAGGTTAIDESQPHVHPADGAAVTPAADESQAHVHPSDTTPVAANWPRPWDPAKPIDVSGVAGVTPEQEARATKLIQDSLQDLPKYADTATAVADGYASIGDAGTGSEHFIKLSLLQDDVLLDPTQPESLVYTVKGDTRTLAGAMFIASARKTDDPTLVNWAGPLMQWHNHGNLCFGLGDNGKPGVVGVVDPTTGSCPKGINTGGDFPMVHVWITPHPCGVFAALEGVGAGQAAVPDTQRVDMCNQPHNHSGAAADPKPYDPTQPIDLGGVAGVTPQQQAAAENLVAVNVVQLPQWSDYKVAEAAGFHSIGDGFTGFEHFIHWDWINDNITLDPAHPEALVYVPQTDGSKKLVSAMYMLPDTVKLADVPNIGGALMQWHIHDNLCFTTDPVAPQLADVAQVSGQCGNGLKAFPTAPMIHIWITPNKCGPFAALEGVGAGQIQPGQSRLCDHVHGKGF
jgi:hypothetical protein